MFGIEIGTSRIVVDDTEFEGTAYGFTIAPAIGWIFDKSSTKKQITLYPLMYTGYAVPDAEPDTDLTDDEDFTIGIIKSRAAFSWQWGNKVWNGFEAGIDFNWDPEVKCENQTVIDDDKIKADSGFGFEFYAAYKLTLGK